MPRMPSRNPRKSAAAGANKARAKLVWILLKVGDGAPALVAGTPDINDGRMIEITDVDLQPGILVTTDQNMAATK